MSPAPFHADAERLVDRLQTVLLCCAIASLLWLGHMAWSSPVLTGPALLQEDVQP